MGQIKCVLMNIVSISTNIQDNMVENGEIRRTIKYLMILFLAQVVLHINEHLLHNKMGFISYCMNLSLYIMSSCLKCYSIFNLIL